MSEKIETWTRTESRKVADCRVFRVREDFCERASDAKIGTFFVVENPDWVNIIPVTKTGEIILIEQYRHGIEQIVLEIPGGMVDEDETPLAAAQRELLEETGFSADEWISLGASHPNPAIQNNKIYHYLAVGCEKTAAANFDEHESIGVKMADAADIDGLIETEQISHSLVLTAFHRYALHRRRENAGE